MKPRVLIIASDPQAEAIYQDAVEQASCRAQVFPNRRDFLIYLHGATRATPAPLLIMVDMVDVIPHRSGVSGPESVSAIRVPWPNMASIAIQGLAVDGFMPDAHTKIWKKGAHPFAKTRSHPLQSLVADFQNSPLSQN